MSPTRVFVVASSVLVRAGLRSMLAEAGTDLEIVGEGLPGDLGIVGGTGEPVELAEPIGATESPGLHGVEAVLVSEEALDEEAGFAILGESTVPLILLSDSEEAALRLKALRAPAWGVVSPEASPEELAAAIRAVAEGFVVLPGALAERLLEEGPGRGPQESPAPLTAREKEVLELLSQGLANKAIARRLTISEHTVKFHVSSVYAKLSVASRAEAVSRGARLGLIKL